MIIEGLAIVQSWIDMTERDADYWAADILGKPVMIGKQAGWVISSWVTAEGVMVKMELDDEAARPVFDWLVSGAIA